MIALVAVTSITGANSSYITRHRPAFHRLVFTVALSFTLAFVVHQEWVFAALTLLWCASAVAITRIGYHGTLELLELRKASERTARHDDLTGLLSRTAFFEALEVAATTAPKHFQKYPRTTALVLFDLDGFKAINDSFGHAAGDAVLVAVANRLELFLPSDATVARLGGDEFAAVFTAEPSAVAPTVETVLAAISEPLRVDGRELYVAASAGWTVVQLGSKPADLLAEADAAMYQSKNSQTATSTGFDILLQTKLTRSLDVRHRFRSALKRDEIEFWVQPIVRTSDGTAIAVELLARWPQADETMIGPLEFTRVAEETGLAVELDRQALCAARDLLVSWAGDPILGNIVVKANISAIHLHNGELLQSVTELIPRELRSRLGLEFVESRLISAAERNHDQLATLLDMGIVVSIDDFGVGYSSLAYLRSLPVSEIKIDRSFVTDLDTDPVNRGLVRAIVDIAATLGLPTVAEGIETEAELEAATRLGVNAAQGYFLGRPHRITDAGQVVLAVAR